MSDIVQIHLKEWRWEKMYEQTKLAEELGISQELLSRIESGSMKASIRVRRKFFEKFGKEEMDKIIELCK